MDEGESSMDKKHAFRKNISFYLSVVFNVIEGMLAGFNFIVLYYTIKALITEQLTMSMLTQTILLLGAVFVIRLIVYAFGYTRGQIGGAQVSRILRLSLGDKMKKYHFPPLRRHKLASTLMQRQQVLIIMKIF